MKKIILILLFIPFIVYAQPHKGPIPMEGMHWEMGEWWKNPKVLQKLELSNSQIKKIYKLRCETEKKLIDIGAELRKLEIELRDLIFEDNLNETKIKKLIKEINKLRGKIFEKIELAKLEVWKLLTDEQRKKLKKMLLYREMKMRKKHRKGR